MSVRFVATGVAFVAVALAAATGCVPAIIGVSFALGGATVGVTYEILDDDPKPQDAGADR